jgi:SAM-dependent methyltransferase
LKPNSPPLAAIALLSAAALSYEILLTRLFSIIQWHHFAYMIISVAMLGYGAAGVFVAICQRTLLPRFEAVFVGAAAAFGVTALATFLLAQRVAFNPLEMLWDPAQPLRLLAIYALLSIPFLCAATCICLSFARFAFEPHRIYSYDILGAGVGCLAILGALFVTTPPRALQWIGALGLLAAALAGYSFRMRRHWVPAALLAGAAVLAFGPAAPWTVLHPSSYKDLSQTLVIPGTRVVAERSNPIGLITIVESPLIPFRHAPGMSLNSTVEPPPQLGVYTDGDGPVALTHYDGQRAPLAYLDALTSALPYHLLERPRVLVLGAGAGGDVLQAIYQGAREIDAVELNPEIVDLVANRFADYSGGIYSIPGVRVHIGEARRFVAAHSDRFALIQVALLDAFGTSSAGLYSLSESYLYTVEALREYLDHLAPGGLLAVTRWVNLPPRDVLKLFATAVAALEAGGTAQPAQQLALIRGWKTATLLVKNGAFTAAEIVALKQFCYARSFDLAYYPGITAAEVNRFNVLERPEFYDGARALLGPEREAFIASYKFNIAPATDDRPYFFQFFKWRTLPELLALKEQGGLPLLEWGYPVLVATLAQALLASLLLILLPLLLGAKASREGTSVWSRWRIAAYFAAIGFAFMFIEIAFIQKFILFLGHPLYAVAVVLCAFLLFAGLGSRYSERVEARLRGTRVHAVGWVVVALALIALCYLVLLPAMFRPLLPLPDPARITVSIALIAPLAFAMGMPFPLGLASVAGGSQPLVAWAWGINACASVVAAILATLLAIHFGFSAVVGLAVALYLLAAVVYR